MKKLRNTLYITTEDAYLSLDGETVVVLQGEQVLMRVPLHTLEEIVCFSYKGASPALMGACGSRGVHLCFYTPQGRFLAATCGELRGNVLLRKAQYRISEDEQASAQIARSFLFGKLYNSRWVLERATRDHPLQLDTSAIKASCQALAEQGRAILLCMDLSALRGIEGSAAERYFSHFNELILTAKEDFAFSGRNRRPPLDRTNALLSFLYALLANACAGALQSVGLDPYVGFLHRERPGRMSLSLDMMEELRCLFADRLALSMINMRMLRGNDFSCKENGVVLLTKEGRKKVLSAWQGRKQDVITHPYLNEKIPWGMVPYTQALLLARHLRGDLDAYPPFLWK